MNPLDYSLCNQTVTVYRKKGNEIIRQEILSCHYAWQEDQQEDETGIYRQTKCLMIVPGEQQRVFIGDRVYDGIGPQIGLADWATFIPVLVPGLTQINYVAPYYWGDTLCHWEAGRK